MNKIYVVRIYEYDSYSFSGFSESQYFFFSTAEKAEEWATINGYSFVNVLRDPYSEATLDDEEVDQY